MKLVALLTLLACWMLSQLSAYTFTSVDGRKLEAEIIDVNGAQITLKRAADGREFVLNLDRLVPEDAEYIQSWTKENASVSKPATSKDPIGPWPRKVKPENYKVTIIRENTAKKEYIYRTPHFEFHSNVKLARKVVREFSQIFESTFLAVGVLPMLWQPEVSESGRLVTQIFETKEQYIAAGGPTNSGGVYFPRSRKIMLPLRNLGVKKSSSGYTLDDGRDRSVLAHEITHQVTHQWLGRIPVWASEGIAEYIQNTPYERGTFRFDRYDIEDVLRRDSFFVVDLKSLMNMGHREWVDTLAEDVNSASRNYLSAFMLQYYFFHFELDEEGKPRLYYDYLRAIEKGESKEVGTQILLDGRSYEELQVAVQKAYKREDIEIIFD